MDEKRHKIRHDPDYIYCEQYDFSLKKWADSPDGDKPASLKFIKDVLLLKHRELKAILHNIKRKIKRRLGGNDPF